MNNPDKEFSLAAYVKSDPQTAALISKMVPDQRLVTKRDAKGNRKINVPQTAQLLSQMSDRAKKNRDAQLQLETLPDVAMATRILISSIMAPADMTSTEVGYNGPSNIFTTDLSNSILSRLKEFYENDFKIKELLPVALENIIAKKGSHITIIIPENALDAFVNSGQIGTEGFNVEFERIYDSDGRVRNLGILGRPQEKDRRKVAGLSLENFRNPPAAERIPNGLHMNFGMESIHIDIPPENLAGGVLVDDNIFITDNISVLRSPQVIDRIRQDRVARAYMGRGMRSFGMESKTFRMGGSSTISDYRIESSLTQRRSHVAAQVSELETPELMSRRSVGRPLIITAPSESILPVTVPGDPTKHIGHFALIDEEGNFIQAAPSDQFYNSMRRIDQNSQNSLGSNLLRRASSNVGRGAAPQLSNVQADMMVQIYSEMVERDFINRIKNGVIASTVKVANNNDFYRTMLSRTLTKQFTQVLFIPLDYISYMAFDYDDYGVGRSLLDMGSTINSMRAMVLVSDVLANMKNSIGLTRVNVKLDEKDPDPAQSFETMRDFVVEGRRWELPTTPQNISDITDAIARAGYDFQVEGHPGLPDMTYVAEQHQTSFARPDDSLKEDLKRQSIQLMGLSPEQVDNGLNGEFATTIVSNNILLAKRVMQFQDNLMPQVSDLCRKAVLHNEGIIDDLRSIVGDAKDQIKIELDDYEKLQVKSLSDEEKTTYLVNKAIYLYIDGLGVTLPRPPSVTLEHQLADLATYSDGLETVLTNAFISGDLVPELIAGSASTNVDTLKAQIKGFLIRKFMADKGIFTELGELIAIGEDGKPQIDLVKESLRHAESIVRSCVRMASEVAPVAAAATADIEKITEAAGVDPDAGGSSGDSGGGEEPEDAGGGDDSGGEEPALDGGDDLELDAAPEM
jgi:hypothetical protein